MTKRRRKVQPTLFSLCLITCLTGCVSLESRYEIDPPATEQPYPPTRSVSILTEPPTKEYRVIARFRGSEMQDCIKTETTCTLKAEARQHGAEAAWIQKRTENYYPGDWIMVEGKLTKIYPYTTYYYEGVFIRYEPADN